MEDDRLSRAFRIRGPAAAAVFADARRRRLLIAFMGRERSLSNAATTLAMPMNRLAHHVGSFLRLGLLCVAREEKRAGRPIRHYRAVADSFLIDAAVMSRSAGAGLSAELGRALEQARPPEADMLVSVDETGRARMERVGEPGWSDACDHWRVLTLTCSEAEGLSRELAALLGKYGGGPGKGRKAYLARAALAPRPPL